MSKDKQIIEDMARKMCRNYQPNGNCASDGDPCELECIYGYCAERIYCADYRKQSEGEWIEASNKPYAACGKKCSLCGARISYREYGHGNHKYCHKCGAKMKGE